MKLSPFVLAPGRTSAKARPTEDFSHIYNFVIALHSSCYSFRGISQKEGHTSMKKKLSKLLLALLIFSITVFVFMVLHGVGLRVNTSESLPGILYRAVPLPDDIPVTRGDKVLIDLSQVSSPVIELGIERGYVSRKRKMLKEIGAVPGDVVLLWENRLYVNGGFIPMLVASEDSRGGALPRFPTPHILPPNYYWLISTPRLGFDSRYFGPINRAAFTHKANPIF
jgi:conjugative transfer signal peptidase TraF